MSLIMLGLAAGQLWAVNDKDHTICPVKKPESVGIFRVINQILRPLTWEIRKKYVELPSRRVCLLQGKVKERGPSRV